VLVSDKLRNEETAQHDMTAMLAVFHYINTENSTSKQLLQIPVPEISFLGVLDLLICAR